MKQEVGRIKDRIAGGIKAKLDALSPEQRLHVVIGTSWCYSSTASGRR